MACEKPTKAFRPANGGPVRFSAPNPDRDPGTYEQINLPCGKCLLCRLEYARQWAVRITHEAQFHETNCFITLTYDDKHLPEHGSLHYPDLQKFWKRLRKEIGPLSYYAVGEYGDNTNRPHYHACVFGHDFTNDRRILRTEPTLLWTSPVLEEAWGNGNVSVGALNFQTAQYTASYVTKKLHGKQYVRLDIESGELVPLVQPRATMSLNPAVGKRWFEKFGNQAYDHDRVIVNGKEQKPPRYYDQLLAAKSETRAEEIKKKRRESATPLTPEETRARALLARARAKSKKKSV